jgi:hypothetical protein
MIHLHDDMTDTELDAAERELQQDIARIFVELKKLNERAESELAAGGDLGMTPEDRGMISEELADHIEFLARLRGIAERGS